MKRFVALLIALCLALGLTACAKKAPTWQEQYDLGARYLSEGNYEEAILAFAAAIEIDPKQAGAYLGLAEAYTAKGEPDKAAETLNRAISAIGETEELAGALAELEGDSAPPPGGGASAPAQTVGSDGSVSTDDGAVALRTEGKTVILSLTAPDLKESYPVNRPETPVNACEYQWMVKFTDGANVYEVGTSSFKGPQSEPGVKTLHEMQTDIWVDTKEGTYNAIGDAQLDIQGTTLTWTFTVPEEYNFDPGHMEILKYTVNTGGQ